MTEDVKVETVKKPKKRRPAYKLEERKTSLSAAVGDAISELENLRDEMTEWRDNLESGNLSNTPKFEQVSECCDALDGVQEIDVPEIIQDLDVSYGEMVPTRKGRGVGRGARRDTAISMLESAKSAAENWLEEQEEKSDTDDDVKDEVDTFVSDVQEVMDVAEGAEFPSMF